MAVNPVNTFMVPDITLHVQQLEHLLKTSGSSHITNHSSGLQAPAPKPLRLATGKT